MNGSANREWFARSAKIRSVDTDWTTIQSAFDSGIQDDDGSHGSNESEILRNESENRLQTRSHNRISFHNSAVSIGTMLTSTPVQRTLSQQSEIDFHSQRSQELNLSAISPIAQNNNNNSHLFEPPLAFQNSLLPAPFGFSSQNNLEIPFLSNQSSFTPNQNIRKIDLPEDYSSQIVDLAAEFVEHSLEYHIMKKLIKLWQHNIRPIGVTHLLSPGCNRFDAAKTFSSLLSEYIYANNINISISRFVICFVLIFSSKKEKFRSIGEHK